MSWIAEMEKLQAEWQALYEGASPSAWTHRPNPKDWSAHDCLDHVYTTNQTYFPIFDAVLNNKYPSSWVTRRRLLGRLMGRWIKKSVSPENRKKVSTFPAFEPSSQYSPEKLIESFSVQQRQLILFYTHLESAQLSLTLIASPASSKIAYPIQDAFQIILLHGQRHLQQAKAALMLH